MGGSRARYSPPLRAGPGSAGRRAPCAGSIAPGPWSCAAWFRVAGTWWDTCPGYPPGRAGPSQPPAPPSLDHPLPPGSNLTSSTVWGLRVPGRPCRRLSTARFTFSVQRGSGWPGHRRDTRPACRTKRSGTRPRAALRGDRASGGPLQGPRPPLPHQGQNIPDPPARHPIGQSHGKHPGTPISPQMVPLPSSAQLSSPATSQTTQEAANSLLQAAPNLAATWTKCTCVNPA